MKGAILQDPVELSGTEAAVGWSKTLCTGARTQPGVHLGVTGIKLAA